MSTESRSQPRVATAPLSDAIMTAVAELVDDAQMEGRRDPTHSDLE